MHSLARLQLCIEQASQCFSASHIDFLRKRKRFSLSSIIESSLNVRHNHMARACFCTPSATFLLADMGIDRIETSQSEILSRTEKDRRVWSRRPLKTFCSSTSSRRSAKPRRVEPSATHPTARPKWLSGRSSPASVGTSLTDQSGDAGRPALAWWHLSGRDTRARSCRKLIRDTSKSLDLTTRVVVKVRKKKNWITSQTFPATRHRRLNTHSPTKPSPFRKFPALVWCDRDWAMKWHESR